MKSDFGNRGLKNKHPIKRTMGPMRFERMTSRLSAGCTTSYATGPMGLTLQHLPL